MPETKEQKPFRITAADGAEILIPAGEYYFNTKARAERMMLNSLSSDARRVYACLELATMGFRQERAVKMVKGERVDLIPGDITEQTGLSRQNTRRGLEELESQGLAERRSINGKGLTKGNICIYSWAEPQPAKIQDCSRLRLQFPEWFPSSWEPIRKLITLHKYRLPQDFESARDYIPAMEAAARDYEKAGNVVTELLERVCAQPPIYKEERTERKERTEETVPVLPCSQTPSSSERANPPARSPNEAHELGRRRRGAPLWHNDVANFLEILPIGTRLDNVILLQITDTLSEELVEQFKYTAKSFDPRKPKEGGTKYAAVCGEGIRNWGGVLAIAKQVAARGEVKAMSAIASETDFQRRYLEEMERRRKEEPDHG